MTRYAAPTFRLPFNNSASRRSGRPLSLVLYTGSARACLLVLIGDVLELGIDDLLVLRTVRGAPGRIAGGPAGLPFGLLRLVHRLAQLHRRLGERVGLGLDVLDILAGQR